MKHFDSDLDLEQSRRDLVQFLPVVVGQNVFLFGASLLDEEVPLLISMGVVKQLGSVIDVAEKTIEFRNFQNAQVPLEVVAGHLTMDFQPKHASALQTQLTPQRWEFFIHHRPISIDSDVVSVHGCHDMFALDAALPHTRARASSRQYEIALSVEESSSSQFCLASRVPYKLYCNSPHMCSSPAW